MSQQQSDHETIPSTKCTQNNLRQSRLTSSKLFVDMNSDTVIGSINDYVFNLPIDLSDKRSNES